MRLLTASGAEHMIDRIAQRSNAYEDCSRHNRFNAFENVNSAAITDTLKVKKKHITLN